MKKNEFIEAIKKSFFLDCEIHTLEKIEGSQTEADITGVYDLLDVDSAVSFFEKNYNEEMVRIGENHSTMIISFEVKPKHTNENQEIKTEDEESEKVIYNINKHITITKYELFPNDIPTNRIVGFTVTLNLEELPENTTFYVEGVVSKDLTQLEAINQAWLQVKEEAKIKIEELINAAKEESSENIISEESSEQLEVLNE
jgi:hypothetical protein